MCWFPHIPRPEVLAFRCLRARWPLVIQEMRIPYIFAKLSVIGSRPCPGFEDKANHGVAYETLSPFYPRMVARRAMDAAASHFWEDPPHFGRAGCNWAANVTGGEFLVDLLTLTFGVVRMTATPSGIESSTRARYLPVWKRWQKFMNFRN